MIFVNPIFGWRSNDTKAAFNDIRIDEIYYSVTRLDGILYLIFWVCIRVFFLIFLQWKQDLSFEDVRNYNSRV